MNLCDEHQQISEKLIYVHSHINITDGIHHIIADKLNIINFENIDKTYTAFTSSCK